jgi:hypothetical protein
LSGSTGKPPQPPRSGFARSKTPSRRRIQMRGSRRLAVRQCQQPHESHRGAVGTDHHTVITARSSPQRRHRLTRPDDGCIITPFARGVPCDESGCPRVVRWFQ